MKRILTLTVASASILATQSILAEDNLISPKWNKIEIDFITISVDNNDELNPKGISIKGTKLLTNNIFGIAGYSYIEEDFMGINLEIDSYTIGLGHKQSISNNTDLYGALTYEYVNVNGFDDDAFKLTVGARHMVSNKIELGAKLDNLIANSESNLSFNVNANYLINDNFSVGIGYTIAEESKTTNIGVRLSISCYSPSQVATSDEVKWANKQKLPPPPFSRDP